MISPRISTPIQSQADKMPHTMDTFGNYIHYQTFTQPRLSMKALTTLQASSTYRLVKLIYVGIWRLRNK